MFPIFVPDSSSSSRDPRSQAVLMGMVVLIVLGLGFMLFMRGALLSPAWIMVMLLVCGIIGLTVVLVTRVQQAQGVPAGEEKAKRDLDMYSVIDRLVEDLDEDEAVYLRRRLAEREGGPEQDVRLSLDDLLQQRDRDRRDGKR